MLCILWARETAGPSYENSAHLLPRWRGKEKKRSLNPILENQATTSLLNTFHYESRSFQQCSVNTSNMWLAGLKRYLLATRNCCHASVGNVCTIKRANVCINRWQQDLNLGGWSSTPTALPPYQESPLQQQHRALHCV